MGDLLLFFIINPKITLFVLYIHPSAWRIKQNSSMSNKFISIILISILLLSCTKKETLIQNQERLADIQRMLTVQKELTSKSLLPIWTIFDQPLTAPEKQAMEFLYAYMPLSDLADYKPEFFLKNVQMSLLARQEMPWGKTIPEKEFLHFVLPLRVNNENMDAFREVMYPEIKERIKGLSMKDAALEINHWCHEKVSYRGTDSRTSAPLSAVKKAFGRCGEESTFAVTALRTAGIPARQVYTPRWAHSDDNHAWVEVWIDGKWNYLGACEPDVDLNMGWFSEPARRTMLVHTRAFGRYFGSEDVVIATDRFSELNLTSNYATVKKVTISVKNSSGTPADSAKVEFQLYNYAEYYPIATAFTDKNGMASLSTGMGDLVIWASKSGKFAYQKLSVPEKDTLELVLNQSVPANSSESFDLVPPHAVKVEMNVTKEARKENDRRLAREDSIRGAYMKTFKDSVWIAGFAEKTKLPFDTISRFFKLSFGNWDQVSAYLEKNAPQYRSTVLDMAIQLSDKDFSDARESDLTDHLVQTAQSGAQKMVTDKDIFNRYVLSPRIALENLSPWRSFLRASFGAEMEQSTRTDISVLTNWIRKNININSVANKHSRAPLTPIGVYNLRVADPESRDIFFVATCRTFGIPARLNPETRIPEYSKNGEWLRAGFDPEAVVQPEKGSLQLVDKNNPVAPQYSLHYTIAILRDGFYRTLEFPEGEKLSNSAKPLILEVGHYALVTGNRLEDGSVLSQMSFFNIEKGKLTTVPVELRKQSGEIKPSGKLNLEQLNLEKTGDGKVVSLFSLAAGKHSVLVLLDPDKEPSKHILNDLGPYVDHFNKWGGQFVFAMPAEKSAQAGVLKTYKLPARTESGIDQNGNILSAISAIYGDGLKDKLPLVLFCDESGNVFMFSSGYKIGVGEQLLKVISMVELNRKMTAVKVSCTK
jgi:hypothetical protein